MTLVCYKCGREMQIIMDTPLCPVCDTDVLFELKYVRVDMKRDTNG